jgi:hypothetical protein
MNRTLLVLLGFLLLVEPGTVFGQTSGDLLSELTKPHDYILRRISSYDRTGGNDDYRPLAPGETLTLLDEGGPGEISHVWITIADDERFHLKKMVLRMYWDGESSPSVEAPVGDFFGLGLGEYFLYQSVPLSVGGDKALNCFFPMPFQKHARITLTNEGRQRAEAVYWNIDMRAYKGALPTDTLYFHAQYRQATPNKAFPESKTNLDGKDNYVWMEAAGRGHLAGVTMSVVENQDGWSTEPARRIIFWARGILVENLSVTDYSERRSSARNCRAGGGPFIGSIWILPFRLQNHCARRLSTGMPTIGETTFIQ